MDHVPQRPGAVVIAGPALEGQVLVEDDLHFCYVPTVPDGLQEVVGKAEAQDVQDGGLAQEMVHAVDVVFRHEGQERAVQFARRLFTRAEGLLHDEAGAGRDLARLQDFAGFLAHLGRQCEVDGHGALELSQQ